MVEKELIVAAIAFYCPEQSLGAYFKNIKIPGAKFILVGGSLISLSAKFINKLAPS